jgi:hypothetical protein
VTGKKIHLQEIPSHVSHLCAQPVCPILRRFLYITAFVERKLIPVGPAYLAHVRRTVHDLSFEEHDKHVEEEQKRRRDLEQEGYEEDDLGVGDEEETEDLLSLDPKEWKVSRGLFSFETPRCTMSFPVPPETRSLCRPRSVAS